MGFLTEEQLLAIGGLPRRHGGAVQVDGDGLAGGQGGLDGVILDIDGGLRQGCTHADGGGLIGTIHYYSCG
jgi:hypothetical protein